MAAFQAAISQPSRRLKLASTGLPSTTPVTVACCGPPYCCVQAWSVARGAGPRMAGLFFRAVQAAAASGCWLSAAGTPFWQTSVKLVGRSGLGGFDHDGQFGVALPRPGGQRRRGRRRGGGGRFGVRRGRAGGRPVVAPGRRAVVRRWGGGRGRRGPARAARPIRPRPAERAPCGPVACASEVLLRCAQSTAGARLPGRLPACLVAGLVAAIRSIMEACSAATWSRVRPSLAIMVPGTASACCRSAAPAAVSRTSRVRSLPSLRCRVMKPAVSRRRSSGEMVAGSWARASLMSRTERGLDSHRHSMTRYCGWVRPSVSSTGLYAPTTLREATVRAKQSCCSSRRSSSAGLLPVTGAGVAAGSRGFFRSHRSCRPPPDS